MFQPHLERIRPELSERTYVCTITGGGPVPVADLFPPSSAKLAPYTAFVKYGVGKGCTTQMRIFL
jgi:hypothetical protein